MTTAEQDLINELNVYSGLDSFNSTVIEKELGLCADLGADVAKLKALGFNALQLVEIRKGLENPKVDATKYMDPKLSWTEMEEMRLEMAQGIDMSEYRKQGFDSHQLYQIRAGLAEGIDVSIYAKREYVSDMRGIAKKMPIECISFLIASLGMVGIPLTCGFISKYRLITAEIALNNREGYFGIAAIIISSVLTLVYLFSIVISAYIPGKNFDESSLNNINDSKNTMKFVFIVITIMIIYFGVNSNILTNFIDLVSMNG